MTSPGHRAALHGGIRMRQLLLRQPAQLPQLRSAQAHGSRREIKHLVSMDSAGHSARTPTGAGSWSLPGGRSGVQDNPVVNRTCTSSHSARSAECVINR